MPRESAPGAPLPAIYRVKLRCPSCYYVTRGTVEAPHTACPLCGTPLTIPADVYDGPVPVGGFAPPRWSEPRRVLR